MTDLPPRKDVTAWDVERVEENGDDFIVLTLHHGLGRMTRADLWPEDARALAAGLVREAE